MSDPGVYQAWIKVGPKQAHPTNPVANIANIYRQIQKLADVQAARPTRWVIAMSAEMFYDLNLAVRTYYRPYKANKRRAHWQMKVGNV